MTTQCFVAEQNTGKKVPLFRWAGAGPWCWLPCTVGLHEAATRKLERPGLADRNYEEGDGKICTHSSQGTSAVSNSNASDALRSEDEAVNLLVGFCF